MSVVCTVPHLPRSKVGPNARLHHHARDKATRAARDEMIAELRNQDCAVSPLWETAHLDIVFTAKDKRRRDLDNLIGCCKPWIDALTDIVIVDDSADRLSLSARYEVGKEEKTVFQISRVEYRIPGTVW